MSFDDPIRMRDSRRRDHAWYDYEIYDVFGDELGWKGIAAYMTLVRHVSWSGWSVSKGLQALADHARMHKSTYAEGLNACIAVGLVIRIPGRTTKSVCTYELVDVKELAHRYRASLVAAGKAPSVALIDRFQGTSVASPQSGSNALHLANVQQLRGSSTSANVQPAAASSAHDAHQGHENNCLPNRQIGSAQPDDGAEPDLSAEVPDFRPDLGVSAPNLSIRANALSREIDKSRESDARATVTAEADRVRRMCRQGDPTMTDVIADQIELFIATADPQPLDEIADEMISAWQEYSDLCARSLIWKPFGFRGFVRDGIWCNRGQWRTTYSVNDKPSKSEPIT